MANEHAIVATFSPLDDDADAGRVLNHTVTPTVHEYHQMMIHQQRRNNSADHSVSLPAVAIAWTTTGVLHIPLYTLILLLAIVGNGLVILTLIQIKRMRTITNVFLLNLAVSDILLGVLCVPTTLIGTLLRDFVFGESMCKLVPFLQGE